MIKVEKHKDIDWGHDFFIAKSTKFDIFVTGDTRRNAVFNLKHELHKKINK